RGAQAKLQEVDVGSGLCATRIPGWRNARGPACRCGLATIICAARREAGAARGRDAYL
ncbi:hypothetical protein A2U01_0096422, partial [Trifolium medium]|nr:hypothetical protein [Trifolium medium]